MPTPRLITHRPEALRLPDWEWLIRRDQSRRLAAWLDVSYADGDDWHDPDVVLLDVTCLDLLEVLYGPRAGFTLALGAGGEDTAVLLAAQDAHRVDVGIDVRHPAGLSALRSILARYASGVRPPAPQRPERPRLRLVGQAETSPAVGG